MSPVSTSIFPTGGRQPPQHRARPRRDRLRRHQLRDSQAVFPSEGEPRYSGINMWRGVTRWKPMLSGASMVAGGLAVARQDGDLSDPSGLRRGRAAASSTGWPKSRQRPIASATGPGPVRSRISSAVRRLAFRLARCAGVHPCADSVLEFPMVDQDPLPRWSFGRGDLARRRRAPDGAARLQWRRPGDPGRARAGLGVARQRRSRCRARAYEKQRLELPHASF